MFNQLRLLQQERIDEVCLYPCQLTLYFEYALSCIKVSTQRISTAQGISLKSTYI